MVERALTSGRPVLYDCDDNFFAVPATHPLKSRLARCAPWVEQLARRAEAITVASDGLARVFARLNPNVRVLPNLLDPALWPLVRFPGRSRTSGPVTVGVCGTASHGPDAELLREPALALAGRYRQGVAFVFYGFAPAWAAQLPNARFVPFDDNYAGYARRLRRLELDFALAPLADNAFNRCKSGIKWLEYAACGAPGVFSEMEPYASVVEHDRTGLLVPNEAEAWREAAERLIREPETRRGLARDAWEGARNGWSLAQRGRAFVETWREVVDKGGRR